MAPFYFPELFKLNDDLMMMILFNTKTVTDTKVEKKHTNMCP